MNDSITSKTTRLIEMFSLLNQGEILQKDELAQIYHVTEKSIQRDIDDLRCFFAERNPNQTVVYDAKLKGYRMIENCPNGLTNDEILAVCKILLESRSMPKSEMFPILDKLLSCAVPKENQKVVKDLIANEKFHYIEPHHGTRVLGSLWVLGQAVETQRFVEIEYTRQKDPKTVIRKIKPVGIMFSEYYFYLTAFLEDKSNFDDPDDLFPTIYRIDRIKSFKVLNEHFNVPYASRFEEGEFRKRVQFMYGGKLQNLKFKYSGPSIEAVLDRLPTANIVEKCADGWIVTAEVFGKGIEMWLRSQGDYIKMEV